MVVINRVGCAHLLRLVGAAHPTLAFPQTLEYYLGVMFVWRWFKVC